MTLDELAKIISDQDRLVRAIISGRRRNMHPDFDKIELRPIKLHGVTKLQLITIKSTKSTTTNVDFASFDALQILTSGYANCLIEAVDRTFTVRFTKKGQPQVFEETNNLKQDFSHDRLKSRLLDPNSDFLLNVGISNRNGIIKPSMNNKYRQIEEFLRVLMPTLNAEIRSGRLSGPTKDAPLRIVDHGCGNAYLTFAVNHYLSENDLPNTIVGIDQREESRARNTAIADELAILDAVSFRAEKIADSDLDAADLAIALHACDTATDDAIAWSINHHAKILMVSPCCHHDLQTQIRIVPDPWSVILKHGILKERFVDVLTDSLRAQILKLHGYKCDVIEFVGDEHTPRNSMIRAIATGAKPEPGELDKYREITELFSIRPKLAELLNFA